VKLSDLLRGIAPVTRDVELRDLALDSRNLQAGDVFLACTGSAHHGLDFLTAALQRDVVAVLWEPSAGIAAPQLPPQVVGIAVPGLHARASELAARVHGDASHAMAVIGVTGTNGKTTTAWLLAQALTACAKPAAYLGTLGAGFGSSLQPGELTTPDAVALQRQLGDFASRGAAAVALEVSSHALAQSRVDAVAFDAAVFTNLSRDHLDYHGTMQAYAAAKTRLFERPELRLRVINADDALGATLLARADAGRAVATSRNATFVAPAGCDWLLALDVHGDDEGTQFTLRSSFGTASVRSALLGGFNIDNLLAVLGVLLGSGVMLAQAVEVVAQLQAPPGRLQRFGGGSEPLVVVDYAHTPDALHKALQVLREHCSGQLWCVFGCGGDRDTGKRSQMGQLAAELADRLILTDDNPRGEAPDAITAQIRSGIDAATTTARELRVIHDRGAAIATAVAAAAAGDAVLVAGKGHEDYQLVGGQRLAFSDARCVQDALALRRAA
jgi:UDP-N-acetylmuramoyl-L-alanyl-D-glutamate--2,6-diaminopimelate ligase